jgi:hypothetical protein
MKKLKNILIFVLILAAAFVAYIFLREPKTPALQTIPTTTLPPGQTPETAIGQEFLSMLLSLRDIRLDGRIFQNAQFRSLRDFSTPITRVPGEEGRPNPFAPIETPAEALLVETGEATLITSNQATLNGLVNLTLAGDPKLFAWGTTPELANTTELITETTGTGFFSKTLTGLLPGTTYFYRAEVVSGRQTIRGEIFSFTTTLE